MEQFSCCYLIKKEGWKQQHHHLFCLYSETDLWTDYWTRFETFCEANNISSTREPLVFLTNQSSTTFKTIDTFVSRQTTPTTAHKVIT